MTTGAISDIEDKRFYGDGQTNVDTVRNKTDAITINRQTNHRPLGDGTPLDADNISQNGTNKFTTAANNTKLGFISVTQAVPDVIEQDVDDIAVAIDLDNNGDAARTHAGAEVALWNNNGFGAVATEARGNLKTTAGEVLMGDFRRRWVFPAPYTLVTTRRAPLYFARFFTTAPPRTVGTLQPVVAQQLVHIVHIGQRPTRAHGNRSHLVFGVEVVFDHPQRLTRRRRRNLRPHGKPPER